MTTIDAETTPTTADLVACERQTGANSLIKNYVIAATGLGFLPMPLVDLASFMALQIKLVHGLAKHYDVPFKENIGKSLITSLLSGATGIIGVMGLGSLAKAIPGLGTLAGGASVGITAGSLTYAVGQVFARHFESGGTLLDFDPKKMRDLFKHKVKEGKETAETVQAKEGAAPTAAAG